MLFRWSVNPCGLVFTRTVLSSYRFHQNGGCAADSKLQKTPGIPWPHYEFGGSTDLEPSLYLEKCIEVMTRGSALSTYDQSESRRASPYHSAIWSCIRVELHQVSSGDLVVFIYSLSVKSNIILDLKPVFLTPFFVF